MSLFLKSMSWKDGKGGGSSVVTTTEDYGAVSVSQPMSPPEAQPIPVHIQPAPEAIHVEPVYVQPVYSSYSDKGQPIYSAPAAVETVYVAPAVVYTPPEAPVYVPQPVEPVYVQPVYSSYSDKGPPTYFEPAVAVSAPEPAAPIAPVYEAPPYVPPPAAPAPVQPVYSSYSDKKGQSTYSAPAPVQAPLTGSFEQQVEQIKTTPRIQEAAYVDKGVVKEVKPVNTADHNSLMTALFNGDSNKIEEFSNLRNYLDGQYFTRRLVVATDMNTYVEQIQAVVNDPGTYHYWVLDSLIYRKGYSHASISDVLNDPEIAKELNYARKYYSTEQLNEMVTGSYQSGANGFKSDAKADRNFTIFAAVVLAATGVGAAVGAEMLAGTALAGSATAEAAIGGLVVNTAVNTATNGGDFQEGIKSAAISAAVGGVSSIAGNYAAGGVTSALTDAGVSTGVISVAADTSRIVTSTAVSTALNGGKIDEAIVAGLVNYGANAAIQGAGLDLPAPINTTITNVATQLTLMATNYQDEFSVAQLASQTANTVGASNRPPSTLDEALRRTGQTISSYDDGGADPALAFMTSPTPAATTEVAQTFEYVPPVAVTAVTAETVFGGDLPMGANTHTQSAVSSVDNDTANVAALSDVTPLPVQNEAETRSAVLSNGSSVKEFATDTGRVIYQYDSNGVATRYMVITPIEGSDQVNFNLVNNVSPEEGVAAYQTSITGVGHFEGGQLVTDSHQDPQRSSAGGSTTTSRELLPLVNPDNGLPEINEGLGLLNGGKGNTPAAVNLVADDSSEVSSAVIPRAARVNSQTANSGNQVTTGVYFDDEGNLVPGAQRMSDPKLLPADDRTASPAVAEAQRRATAADPRVLVNSTSLGSQNTANAVAATSNVLATVNGIPGSPGSGVWVRTTDSNGQPVVSLVTALHLVADGKNNSDKEFSLSVLRNGNYVEIPNDGTTYRTNSTLNNNGGLVNAGGASNSDTLVLTPSNDFVSSLFTPEEIAKLPVYGNQTAQAGAPASMVGYAATTSPYFRGEVTNTQDLGLVAATRAVGATDVNIIKTNENTISATVTNSTTNINGYSGTSGGGLFQIINGELTLVGTVSHGQPNMRTQQNVWDWGYTTSPDSSQNSNFSSTPGVRTRSLTITESGASLDTGNVTPASTNLDPALIQLTAPRLLTPATPSVPSAQANYLNNSDEGKASLAEVNNNFSSSVNAAQANHMANINNLIGEQSSQNNLVTAVRQTMGDTNARLTDVVNNPDKWSLTAEQVPTVMSLVSNSIREGSSFQAANESLNVRSEELVIKISELNTKVEDLTTQSNIAFKDWQDNIQRFGADAPISLAAGNRLNDIEISRQIAVSERQNISNEQSLVAGASRVTASLDANAYGARQLQAAYQGGSESRAAAIQSEVNNYAADVARAYGNYQTDLRTAVQTESLRQVYSDSSRGLDSSSVSATALNTTIGAPQTFVQQAGAEYAAALNVYNNLLRQAETNPEVRAGADAYFQQTVSPLRGQYLNLATLEIAAESKLPGGVPLTADGSARVALMSADASINSAPALTNTERALAFLSPTRLGNTASNIADVGASIVIGGLNTIPGGKAILEFIDPNLTLRADSTNREISDQISRVFSAVYNNPGEVASGLGAAISNYAGSVKDRVMDAERGGLLSVPSILASDIIATASHQIKTGLDRLANGNNSSADNLLAATQVSLGLIDLGTLGLRAAPARAVDHVVDAAENLALAGQRTPAAVGYSGDAIFARDGSILRTADGSFGVVDNRNSQVSPALTLSMPSSLPAISIPPRIAVVADEVSLPSGRLQSSNNTQEISQSRTQAVESTPPQSEQIPDDFDLMGYYRGDNKPNVIIADSDLPIGGVKIQEASVVPQIAGEDCGARAIRLNNQITGQDIVPYKGGYFLTDFISAYGSKNVIQHTDQASVLELVSGAPAGSTFLIGLIPKDPSSGVAHIVNAQLQDGKIFIRDAGLPGKYNSSDLGMFTAGNPQNYTFYTVASGVSR